MVPTQQSPDARPAQGGAPGIKEFRWGLMGIGGFVVGLVGSIGLLIWNGHRNAAPSREAAQLLAQVEADMQAKRWEEAIGKARRVLATKQVQPPLLERARSLSDRAEAETKNRAIYARFTQRAGLAHYDAAIEAYRELPADSASHAQAAEDYGRLFPMFVDSHLQLAQEARKRGDCDEVKVQAQIVLSVEQRHIRALMVKEQPCTPSPPSDTDDVLSEAQTHFVNGEYAQAIAKARSVQKDSPVRAWRIIGSAACHTKDSKLASEAFRKLDVPGRQYLVYVCQREETPVEKTSDPPADPSTSRDLFGKPDRRRPAK